MSKRILDACCGSRMFWFDKKNPDVEFVDCREFEDAQIWKSGDGKAIRYCSVKPDTVADFTDLPFEDETFYLVVFDPAASCSRWQKFMACEKIRSTDRKLARDVEKRIFRMPASIEI